MAITEIIKGKKYKVRISYRDPFGTPRNKSQTVHGSFLKAAQVEERLRNEIDNGINSPTNFKQLFQNYVHANNKQEETARKENELYDKFLKSVGRLKLENIRPLDILELKNKIEIQDGSKRQKNKAIYLAKRIFKFGHTYYNIGDFYELLTPIPKLVSDKFNYNIYTVEEFDEVNSFVKNKTYRLMYDVYFWTGLRRGELLALTPRHVLDSKELLIEFSINNKGELGPPKNESSYRKVMIHDELFEKLLPYKKMNGVSLWDYKRYIAPTNINRNFTNAIRDCNKKRLERELPQLPHVRIHDLRHSHASFLASQGVPIQVISARLGHASITETMNTYMHLFKGDEERAVGVIESYIIDLKSATKRATKHEN